MLQENTVIKTMVWFISCKLPRGRGRNFTKCKRITTLLLLLLLAAADVTRDVTCRKYYYPISSLARLPPDWRGFKYLLFPAIWQRPGGLIGCVAAQDLLVAGSPRLIDNLWLIIFDGTFIHLFISHSSKQRAPQLRLYLNITKFKLTAMWRQSKKWKKRLHSVKSRHREGIRRQRPP